MKNYKKGLLCVMVLSAMPLMAADERTINVNTFEDENGENLNNCSLREALIAAEKNAAYGGCSKGNTNNTQRDIIQLEAGTYTLKHGELKPESTVLIQGKNRYNFDRKHVLTGMYPAFEDVKTTIDANGKSRIFNTATSFAALAVNDLVLKNGSADLGGAIFAGGDLSLDRSMILNSTAKAGGAIYNVAQNGEQTLTITGSLLQGNNADKGSVLAMDCVVNMSGSQPIISILQSSIVKNGSGSSASVLDFCGKVSAKVMVNTIAQNIASPVSGSVIKMVSEGNNLVSALSGLSMASNTIVENNAYTAFYYDANGIKQLGFNVLAYNGSGIAGAKSCRFANNAAPSEDTALMVYNNALELSASKCDLPEESLKDAVDSYKNIDVSAVAMSNILSNLMPSNEYNVFLPLYYPKRYAAGYDLLNVSSLNCNGVTLLTTDQRGLERIVDGTLMLNPDARNLCDIGSVEMMDLTAADIQDLTNVSLVALVDSYQAKLDQLKADIEDPAYSEYKIANQADADELEPYLTHLKSSLKYRAIYFDPMLKAIASEKTVDNAGNTALRSLNADNYTVTVKTLGLGTGLTINSGTPTVNQLEPDSDLVCQWNPDLKEIVMYRSSGKVTAPGVFGYCTYTLTEKADAANPSAVLASSSGVIKVAFSNMNPVAVKDVYDIDAGSNLTVRVNPVENDHDNGDGPSDTVPAGKNIWHKNADGKDIPIKFGNLPAGLSFKAEFSGPCPNAFARETCYGGTIEFAVKNNLSQFDYSVPYSVFDSEGAESNAVTIKLQNTAKNTNSSASGGGGSTGIFGLIALAGLAAMRRMRSKTLH